MADTLRIGIAGLGTVGTGVVKMLEKNSALIKSRSGRKIEISCVSAKTKKKKRSVDLSKYKWIDKPEDIAKQDIDVVVELMGGSEGTALNLIKSALKNGKHVVTANKALLAHHGYELAELAEKNGVSLNYEAAVAGGIPVIKAVRESLMGNRITGIYGILNGTSNYILSEMRKTRRAFKDVLKDAQSLGYAEADPTFDIEGVDAGHKLSLLASLAFGTKPDFKNVKTKGISHISETDIAFATELGYRIKLLASAREVDGKILQTVEPTLVRENSSIGMTEDVFNAVTIEGDFVQKPFLTGRGAGEGPTASSVISDLIDIARGSKIPTFGVAAKDLKTAKPMQRDAMKGHYYLRLNVLDKPGVMADIAAILRDHNISIEGLVQRGYGRDDARKAPIMIHTHVTTHKAISGAVAELAKRNFCVEKPCVMLMIEDL